MTQYVQTMWDAAMVDLWYPLAWALCSAGVGLLSRVFKRRFLAWFALSLVFSPWVAVVFLIVAGIPHGPVVREQREALLRSRHQGATAEEIRALSVHEGRCPHCGAALNTLSGEGVRRTEEEAWKVICASCQKEVPGEAWGA